MRKLISLVALMSMSLVLAACDFDSVWESLNQGTTKGFAYCIEAGKKQNLSQSVVRGYCSDRHERDIGPAQVEGKARIGGAFAAAYLAGTFQNKSPGYIITGFRIYVRSKKGVPVLSKTFSRQWVEPDGSGYFEVSQAEVTTKLAEDEEKDGWEWNVTDLKGIKILF